MAPYEGRYAGESVTAWRARVGSPPRPVPLSETPPVRAKVRRPCRACGALLPAGSHSRRLYCNDLCRQSVDPRRTDGTIRPPGFQEVFLPTHVPRSWLIDRSVVEMVVERGPGPRDCRHDYGWAYGMCKGCLLLDVEIEEIARRRALA